MSNRLSLKSSDPAVRPVGIHTFVDAVFGGCAGFLDLRVLPHVEQAFVPIGDRAALEAFVRPRSHRNVYIGVAVRQRPTDGTLANCGPLPAVFVDLDFKRTDEATARQALAEAPLPPSLVLHTGGGLHAWWLLAEPLDLAHPVNADAAKALLRGLAVALGADLAVAEPARILRLPGTLNHKYDPPRRVGVEVFDPSVRYALSDFWWVAIEEEAAPRPAPPRVRSASVTLPPLDRARKYLATMPTPIIGSGSDRATYEAACRLTRGFALSEADAEDLIWSWCGGGEGWDRHWVAAKVAHAASNGKEAIGGLL